MIDKIIKKIFRKNKVINDDVVPVFKSDLDLLIERELNKSDKELEEEIKTKNIEYLVTQKYNLNYWIIEYRENLKGKDNELIIGINEYLKDIRNWIKEGEEIGEFEKYIEELERKEY